MITVQQLARGLSGTRRLLAFDLSAWNSFDKTPEGFWASFTIALVLMPLDLGHVTLQYTSIPAGMPAPSMGLAPYLVVEFLSYVLSWTLFPFVMMYLVRLLQRPARYFWYMVPYNWLQLPLSAFIYSMNLLADFHVIPTSVAHTCEWIGLGGFFIYGTFIASLGLQVGIGTGLSLVVLDFVLGEITGQLIMRI